VEAKQDRTQVRVGCRVLPRELAKAQTWAEAERTGADKATAVTSETLRNEDTSQVRMACTIA
jgi:hypothetical protein